MSSTSSGCSLIKQTRKQEENTTITITNTKRPNCLKLTLEVLALSCLVDLFPSQDLSIIVRTRMITTKEKADLKAPNPASPLNGTARHGRNTTKCDFPSRKVNRQPVTLNLCRPAGGTCCTWPFSV